MADSFSFEDAFRKIVQVNDDLLAGRIDVATAQVHHAGSIALDKLLNTAIKIRIHEGEYGKPMPTIGTTKIFERKAIEGEASIVDVQSIKNLSEVTISQLQKEKVRLPKIFIVGLAPAQAGSVVADFGEHANFDFWKDDGDSRLRSLSKAADAVFINRSQSSHKTTQILDSIKVKYIMVDSGTSNMKKAISEHFKALL